MARQRIAEHIEIDWLDGPDATGRCPNCGAQGPVRRYAEIDYRPPGAAHKFTMQICPHCTVRFIDGGATMDYASDELIEIGWHSYQIQLGAGVWPITAPLARIDKPAGARLLEIGGAYGFGLDFGIRAKGWQGVGFDPSPLAEFGARELGLAMVQGYFTAENLDGGPYDVVLATEVVEHLPAPPEFLALMRRALADDGILLLTTPDAAWITPDLAAGDLLPLLSPGSHVVLQTAESLTIALRDAGFAHVEVLKESMSLVAYASPSPFSLNSDPLAIRALYRRYLSVRSADTAAGSDLLLGFAGRGLFDAANDGDLAAAEAAWAALLPAVQSRFGLDLDAITDLPEAATGASLAALGKIMPLGLGMILFGRAMMRLGRNHSRTDILPLLRLAADAMMALQAALAQRSLTDGLTANLIGVTQGEIALCLAEAGQAEAVPALLAAGPVKAWLGLVRLVNAAAFDAAAALHAALRNDASAEAAMQMLDLANRQDVLAALLLLDLQRDTPSSQLMARLAALKAARLDEARLDDLAFSAFVTLVNADRLDAAQALLPAVEPALRTRRPPYDAGTQNALFSLGVLSLQSKARSLQAAASFARLRDDLMRGLAPGMALPGLFWPCLRGEVLALRKLDRGDEAELLLQRYLPHYDDAPEDLHALLASRKPG